MWCFFLYITLHCYCRMYTVRTWPKCKKILRGYHKGRYYPQQTEVHNFSSVNILGYHISSGIIKPDPERLHPVKELPPPENSKSAKRTLGKFAYYTKLIHNFSDKIRPQVENIKFPPETKVPEAFKQIKQELEVAAPKLIDKSLPFNVMYQM